MKEIIDEVLLHKRNEFFFNWIRIKYEWSGDDVKFGRVIIFKLELSEKSNKLHIFDRKFK